jgi:hypothetical protein
MTKPKSMEKWQPLRESAVVGPPPEDLIKATMDQLKIDRDEAIKTLNDDEKNVRYFVNDLYQVQLRIADYPLLQLNIRRRDGKPIFRDWRHFQQIKNEVVGADCEAVELYPAEDRLVDQGNKYHLWAVADPKFRFPFGWKTRTVDYSSYDSSISGLRQRA